MSLGVLGESALEHLLAYGCGNVVVCYHGHARRHGAVVGGDDAEGFVVGKVGIVIYLAVDERKRAATDKQGERAE